MTQETRLGYNFIVIILVKFWCLLIIICTLFFNFKDNFGQFRKHMKIILIFDFLHLMCIFSWQYLRILYTLNKLKFIFNSLDPYGQYNSNYEESLFNNITDFDEVKVRK